MKINSYGFCLLIIGLLFCVLGCGREHGDTLIPDTVSPSSETHDTADVAKASFEQNLLPILTARCALAGCHVADGPHGLDFRTYESFIAGGDHVFTPGNAQSSDIVEEIVSGRMPPGGPRLSDDQIQLFINWINQQTPTANNQRHDDDDHDDDDDDHDDDDDDDHDDDDDDHDDHDDHDDDHDDDDDDHDDD